MFSGTRRILLASAIVVASAATACSLLDDSGDYGHKLVKYNDDQGEPNRYVNLENGKAQFSVGSPDGHRIVVQWRDPDGSGWTDPETVWTDEKNVAIDNTVRYGGGTVGIRQVYTTDVESESDTDSVTIGIVCRELKCTAAEGLGIAGEAQVTPDGSTVYLGQDHTGVQFWTAEAGIHTTRWSGHPGFEYGVVSPSAPVLAPDGSLRVVSSRPSRGACEFELFTSSAAKADLEGVARTTAPLRGRARSDCFSYLDTFSADWVTVHPDDHRSPTFWFVRTGDTWTTARRDPSGLQRIRVDQGCCDSFVNEFVHWNDVTYGSPDGRRIQVQTHLLGDEQWSEPQILEGAPRGYTCTWMDGHEVGSQGFAVLMACHSGKVRDEYVGDAYVVAASADLATWESAFVSDVTEQPVVEKDRIQVGDETWTPEDGFA